MSGIGIDLVEVNRVRDAFAEGHSRFFESTFSDREREYCLSFADPAPHFAGTFAAKEAVRKATGLIKLPFSSIEIIRGIDGRPETWIEGVRDESVLVSITHTERDAAAVAHKNTP